MTDEQARELLRLLDIYVIEYGGPESEGMVNPHKMTLADLKENLSISLNEGY